MTITASLPEFGTEMSSPISPVPEFCLTISPGLHCDTHSTSDKRDLHPRLSLSDRARHKDTACSLRRERSAFRQYMADLEAGGSAYSHPSRRRTGHTHHGQPRTEEDLSSTAVVWDNELREWRSQEEEVEGRTLRSRTPEPSHDGIRQSPTRDDERLSEVTVAEGGVVGEKQGRRESVAMDPLDSVPSSALAAKEFGDGQPIWLEWEKGDPENPFNVSATRLRSLRA